MLGHTPKMGDLPSFTLLILRYRRDKAGTVALVYPHHGIKPSLTLSENQPVGGVKGIVSDTAIH